uniref:transcription elongation factor SPT4-A-like n=1 Tax=Podarcis muralis TaxID=64176 RepID=UPI00109F3084|nr:transcription elongation factor SPT4-A-like [Podarcis muralis]
MKRREEPSAESQQGAMPGSGGAGKGEGVRAALQEEEEDEEVPSWGSSEQAPPESAALGHCQVPASPQFHLALQTIDQFEFDGCDNCDSYLQMKGNREMVYDCTSSSFDGIIAMMSPEDSWVSKWQRISNFKPGVYAVSVTGRLPQGIVRELKSRGVAYKSRDTAIKT